MRDQRLQTAAEREGRDHEGHRQYGPQQRRAHRHGGAALDPTRARNARRPPQGAAAPSDATALTALEAPSGVRPPPRRASTVGCAAVGEPDGNRPEPDDQDHEPDAEHRPVEGDS